MSSAAPRSQLRDGDYENGIGKAFVLDCLILTGESFEGIMQICCCCCGAWLDRQKRLRFDVQG